MSSYLLSLFAGIAQAIVEHHQGQIQVDSIVGKSTTFTVILPITVGV
ncbi:hypothetical protein VB713_18655 [Anabaena cylindrica UHCC 0172]|nr:hypothetical protein [Anabaena cylindrica]MEA5552969.1 hypothetical protein [Anabaena cylindrica UHCC 0172]